MTGLGHARVILGDCSIRRAGDEGSGNTQSLVPGGDDKNSRVQGTCMSILRTSVSLYFDSMRVGH